MDSKKEEIVSISREQYERIVKDGTGYEPSVVVKRSYLPLRKKDRLWGGVGYPGLFDYDRARDAWWFWFTVTLELVTLGATSLLLSGRISCFALSTGALCIFFLDFMFAYFHHKSKRIEFLIENQKKLFFSEMRPSKYNDRYADYAAHLDQKRKDDLSRKILKPVSAAMIWMISMLKGGLFLISFITSFLFLSAAGASKAPYFIIIVVLASYLWIAYNHLTYTGYFLAGFSHKKLYSSEESEYRRRVGEQNINNQREYKEEKINLKDFATKMRSDNTNPYFVSFLKKSHEDIQQIVDKGLVAIQIQESHGIYKKGNENDYVIYRFGIMTDDHLQKMINAQETQFAQLVVAIYGHWLQMQSGHFDVN